ncbi:MAG: MerR family transcriptional regulator [Solobacterium sp.]|nr:MerR family transcriptional regulator [Solobacterium sp.]
MNYYSQKEICSLLQITRETLRHYEKEGIIVPYVNEANRYRYYDDSHVYLIAETKRYQANEFSLEEIKQMLTADTLAEYTERVGEKADYFEKMAEEYYWKQEYIRDYQMKLRMIPDLLNVVFEGVMEEIGFFPFDGKPMSEADGKTHSFIMDQLRFTFMMLYFPDCTKEGPRTGFGSQKWLLDKFAAEKIPASRLPGSKAVMTVTDTGSDPIVSCSCAEPLLRYAEEKGLKPKGQLIMKQLVKTNGRDGQHRYFETILPVEDE